MAQAMSPRHSVRRRWRFFSCRTRCSKHLERPVWKARLAPATACCSRDILPHMPGRENRIQGLSTLPKRVGGVLLDSHRWNIWPF